MGMVACRIFLVTVVIGVLAFDVMGAAPVAPQGLVSVREFHDLSGTRVTDLTSSSRFPDSPNAVNWSPRFEWFTVAQERVPPSYYRDAFGTQILGYLHPPESGLYTFAINSDDNSVLYLSTDESSGNKREIASESRWNNPREYANTDRRVLVDVGTPNERLENHSVPIRLEGGRAYYIEALAKEGGGGDNLSVTWRRPGADPIANGDQPIPGEFLSTIDRSDLAAPVVTRFAVSAFVIEIDVRDGSGPNARALVTDSVELKVDGVTATPSFTRNATSTTVTLSPVNLPSSDVRFTAMFQYRDDGNIYQQTKTSNDSLPVIPPDFRMRNVVVTDHPRGFDIRMHQIRTSRPGGNTLRAAQAQLNNEFIDPNTGQPYANLVNTAVDPASWDGFVYSETSTINYNVVSSSLGLFVPDRFPPGIPGTTGSTGNLVMEAIALLELPRGIHRMGVSSDDGFQVEAIMHPDDTFGTQLGVFDGSRGTRESLFDFGVLEAGVYVFRLLWWQGGGNGSVEWYLEDSTTGSKNLINNSLGGAVPAYKVPVTELPAHVITTLPEDGESAVAVDTVIQATLKDAATVVDANSVSATVNGVAAGVNVTKTGDTTSVTITPGFSLTHANDYRVELLYQHGAFIRKVSWQFRTLNSIPLSHRLPPGSLTERGFRGRIRQ